MRKGLRGAKTQGTCDRCGDKELADGQGILPEAWMVLRPEKYTSNGPKSLEIIDLCETCSDLFDMFMKDMK